MEHSEIIINENYKGFNPVQLGTQKCPPRWSFGPAVRQYWLLHYIVSGRGRFEREGRVYNLTAGDIFVIPPLIETYYEADGGNPWNYIWVGFTADSVPGEILSSAVIHSPAAGKIFQDMLRCSGMENGKSAYLSSKLWELAALLLEDSPAAPSHIDKALSFMHSEYANGISVGEVAKQLSLERTYFSALFKKSVGISPIDYLTSLRLTRAAELIGEHGSAPLTAANSVGYPDYCHFSKAFKQRFGCSPREYKSKKAN